MTVLATRHTGLVVRDLERSLRFYCDFLGLKLWKRLLEEGPYIEQVVGLAGARVEWAKLKAPDGSLLELLQYHSHPDRSLSQILPSQMVGCSHVAFTVVALDGLYSRLCQAGFHCNGVPQTSPDGNVRVLYAHDPDGIILELVEELTKP